MTGVSLPGDTSRRGRSRSAVWLRLESVPQSLTVVEGLFFRKRLCEIGAMSQLDGRFILLLRTVG